MAMQITDGRRKEGFRLQDKIAFRKAANCIEMRVLKVSTACSVALWAGPSRPQATSCSEVELVTSVTKKIALGGLSP